MSKRIYKGFIEPVQKNTDRFLGQGILPRIVLQEDGIWKDSLPVLPELQARGAIDSINCTAFNTTEQIETYERKAFGENNNYSDRWVALISGTTPQGNDPTKVYEAIEAHGLVPEEMCPWSDDIKTVGEYLSWKGVDKEACFAEGKRWKERKDFLHNWVFKAYQPLDEKLNNMKVALRYSPLCFDVSAWEKNADGKYIRFGQSGHWTMCYGIGEDINVRDSYVPHEKELVKDFNFFYCKRISITKKTPLTQAQKQSIWDLIKAFMSGQPKELKRLEPILKPEPITPNLPVVPPKSPTVWLSEVCKASIGLDLSVQAPNELGCADSLSRLIGKIFPDFPSFLSTKALRLHLDSDKRFNRCQVKPWVIIVSPTVGGNIGHCGILGDNDVIYSNNSKTGKWDKHWTLKKWIAYYRTQKGLQILLYELV